ncbi:triacylglycerol lipase [Nocardia nova]|nr:triacylglycerol lipase [Nocardia nova]
MMTIALTCTAVLGVVGKTGASAEPVMSGPLPVTFDVGTGIVPFFLPEQVPAGANDPNCKPSAAHPNPVVLVNGTFVNQAANWQAGAPFLRNNGYCVYTFNYGKPTWISEIPVQSVADIRDSARELAAEVDKVRAQTHAAKVDLVGASLGGGVLPHYYINFLGGDRVVDKLIGLGPANHGTTADGAVFLRKSFPPLGKLSFDLLGALLPAATQQALGSELMTQTYAGGDTRPGVDYTTIVTKYDEVNTPYTNQFLNGPNVHNILLQDGCDLDFTDHASFSYSERTWRFILNALDPDHTTPVPCIAEGFLFPGVN